MLCCCAMLCYGMRTPVEVGERGELQLWLADELGEHGLYARAVEEVDVRRGGGQQLHALVDAAHLGEHLGPGWHPSVMEGCAVGIGIGIGVSRAGGPSRC